MSLVVSAFRGGILPVLRGISEFKKDDTENLKTGEARIVQISTEAISDAEFNGYHTCAIEIQAVVFESTVVAGGGAGSSPAEDFIEKVRARIAAFAASHVVSARKVDLLPRGKDGDNRTVEITVVFELNLAD